MIDSALGVAAEIVAAKGRPTTLNLAMRRGIVLDDVEKAHMARTTGRDAYRRALDACPATKEFYDAFPKAKSKRGRAVYPGFCASSERQGRSHSKSRPRT